MDISLQNTVFSDKYNRTELLKYEPKCAKEYTIQVFRNHSFELVEHTISVFLDYAEIGAEFLYGGYDDSYSFVDLNSNADLIIIWIDAARYRSDAGTFLHERIKYLKTVCEKPILVVPFGFHFECDEQGVYVYNLDEIKDTLKGGFTDERVKAISGTALSSDAMLLISRDLGLKYIPSLLLPALKAIIVDFDNTLYEGVLGEDGIAGVCLSEGHKNLQAFLKEKSTKGFLLCGVTKNISEDISALLRKRQDFPLKESDFTKIIASWDEKSVSIKKIAEYLNIGVDSMIFIDDNIGEINAAYSSLPAMKLILASKDGNETKKFLEQFPRLRQFNNIQVEDSLRKNDVQANEMRREMESRMSPEDYIRSLDIHLQFDVDELTQAQRIAELSNKTNQFIFNYARYSLAEIEKRMKSENYVVVSASLSDKLSDSGLIGVAVGKDTGEFVEIEECFISCRALGRGIDNILVSGMILEITKVLKNSRVRVNFQKGQRNQPAENFAKTYLSDFLGKESDFTYNFPQKILDITINNKGSLL